MIDPAIAGGKRLWHDPPGTMSALLQYLNNNPRTLGTFLGGTASSLVSANVMTKGTTLNTWVTPAVQGARGFISRGLAPLTNIGRRSFASITNTMRSLPSMANRARQWLGSKLPEPPSWLRPATPCNNSFSADTSVSTKDGSKPISEVHIGEQVLAYNEATGTTESYAVTNVLVHTDPTMVYLTIDGETIVTTPEHPFYVEDQRWVNAADLHFGDRVRNAGGTSGIVTQIKVEQRAQTMYNLTVDTAHTFFVGEGRWLVHNMCGGRLGDLTPDEISQIQQVVDEAQRPLEIVGSTAKGTRRNPGSNLPIGKGANTRSDIDYLVPPGNHPYYRGLEGRLPSIDPETGIIPGRGNTNNRAASGKVVLSRH
jgi:hypothetical protein